MRAVEVKAARISSHMRICGWCLSRQFGRTAEVEREGIGAISNEGECQLCLGAYARRGELAQVAVAALSQYEFADFQVGVKVPKECVDREDEMRAKFKVNSGVGIKKALVGLLRGEIMARLGRQAVVGAADVLVRIDAELCTAEVDSRPIGFMARYTKSRRGLPARAPSCPSCGRAGCNLCGFLGILPEPPSIESQVSQEFARAFSAPRVKITWSGSEDDEALVGGNGRPIYVQVTNPRLRSSGLRSLRMALDGVQLVQAQEAPLTEGLMAGLRKRLTYTILLIRPDVNVDAHALEEAFRRRQIHSRVGRPKVVYWLRVLGRDGDRVVLECEMDNGASPWKVAKTGNAIDADLGIAELIGEGKVSSVAYDVADIYQA